MQALYIHVVMHLLFFVTNFKFLRITILKTIVPNGSEIRDGFILSFG